MIENSSYVESFMRPFESTVPAPLAMITPEGQATALAGHFLANTLWRRYGRRAVKASDIKKTVVFHTFRYYAGCLTIPGGQRTDRGTAR
jgi:hypothetical protein